MAKSFLEKRDFKALTTLNVYSAVQIANENSDDKNKIIFITNFGIVTAEKILTGDFKEDELNESNYSKFISQSAVSLTREALKEHNNEDVLLDKTSFVLENVVIRPYGSDQINNFSSLILFSDQIVGVSSGTLSENNS
ncbi:hypothetical protein [Oceanobacillus jordanicus]|uniref:Uncharacterized protein n=1 Tax=Oceanobacillus jordanicus TaxID=2867266 RepID=A0AAW5B6G9_9BACI|nr:hypothetical protein [Oceanobacillus jordanicus]MCG3418961.1 hypothetical protein [Oceanobacillus jordanicus]